MANELPPIDPNKLVHMLAAYGCLTEYAQSRWRKIISGFSPEDLRRWLDMAWDMPIPAVIESLMLRIKVEQEQERKKA